MLRLAFKYSMWVATLLSSVCFSENQVALEIGVRYRRDSTEWVAQEIANGPTVKVNGTKLKDINHFKNQDLFLIDAKIIAFGSWYYIRAMADYGWICNGRDHEKFIADVPGVGDFRTHGVIQHGTGNSASDLSAAIGFPFQWTNSCFLFVPVVGYSYRSQRIVIDSSTTDHSTVNKDGTIEPPATVKDRLPVAAGVNFNVEPKKVKNQYNTDWYGPFAGFDLSFCVRNCWLVYGGVEYHFALCKRTRDSHIGIKAFDEFSNKTSASGINGTIGVDYFFCGSPWYAGLSLDIKQWRTRHRHKHEGTEKITDAIKWSSRGVNLNFGYLF